MSVPASPDFGARSEALELLDAPGLDPAELTAALGELAFLNAALGGYAATLGALARLLPPGRLLKAAKEHPLDVEAV